MLEHNGKNLNYYFAILFHEKSVFIKSIPDKIDKSKIIYHSVFILNIVIEEKWGLRPTSTKPLPGLAIRLFHIHTMIKFMHGSSSCYTKILLWPILGLLSLITISILNFLCGSSIGGHNSAQLLIFFQDLWLAPSCILQVFLRQMHMVLSFLQPYILLKNKVPWILKWQYVKEGDVLTWQWYVKWWDTFSHTQDVIDNVT